MPRSADCLGPSPGKPSVESNPLNPPALPRRSAPSTLSEPGEATPFSQPLPQAVGPRANVRPAAQPRPNGPGSRPPVTSPRPGARRAGRQGQGRGERDTHPGAGPSPSPQPPDPKPAQRASRGPRTLPGQPRRTRGAPGGPPPSRTQRARQAAGAPLGQGGGQAGARHQPGSQTRAARQPDQPGQRQPAPTTFFTSPSDRYERYSVAGGPARRRGARVRSTQRAVIWASPPRRPKPGTGTPGGLADFWRPCDQGPGRPWPHTRD